MIKMKSRLFFIMRKKQFIGLMIFGTIFMISKIYYHLIISKKNTIEAEDIEFITNKKSDFILENFNPNNLDFEGWKKLGFTDKQVKNILNYKEKVCNGNFTSKEEISKCFAISKEEFDKISKYILLPDKTEKSAINNKSIKTTKKLNINKKFNPNDLTIEDWVKIGFSRAQSESILKYKKFLGGVFQSKEKFRKCFVIDEDKYNQLLPFLIFPDENQKKEEKTSSKITKYFDPNKLDKLGWQTLGFSEKQAKSILNYKEKVLKGKFSSISDIKNAYTISSKKFQEISPWIKFENKIISDTTNYQKKTQTIELNSISFAELNKYGFDEKTSANFINFRKKLGGFMKKNQIIEVYSIDKNLAQKLINESELNTEKVAKIDILLADENTLRDHPYFRKFADKIVFYRISYTNKEKLIKKLNIPQNDWENLKLYLK